MRNSVRHVLPESVNWFPGHMNKGIKEISKKQASIDFLIEIHDSRIPFTGRSDFIRKLGMNRPYILLMNKSDLAEEVDTDLLKNKIFDSCAENYSTQPLEIFFTELISPERQKITLRKIIKCISNYASNKRRDLPSSTMEFTSDESLDDDHNPSFEDTIPPITTLVVGLPNCGKSTLINTLKTFTMGGRGSSVRVGRNPGMTRNLGQPILICPGSSSRLYPGFKSSQALDSNDSEAKIMALDSPGILEPNVRTLTEQLSLGVCGAINNDSINKEILVDYLLFCMNRRRNFAYVAALGLPGPTDDVRYFLASVCLTHHLLLPNSNTSMCRPKRQGWQPREAESSFLCSSGFTGLTNMADQLRQAAAAESAESTLASALTKINPICLPKADMHSAAVFVLRSFQLGRLGRFTFWPEDEQAASSFFHPLVSRRKEKELRRLRQHSQLA